MENFLQGENWRIGKDVALNLRLRHSIFNSVVLIYDYGFSHFSHLRRKYSLSL